MTKKIILRDVTKENWLDVIDLELAAQQEHYVALNSESLAASKFHEDYVNRAVYADEEVVGFIQFYPNHRNGRPDEIFIDQLMIDAHQQHKGYGTQAVRLALEEIRSLKSYASVSICYVEGHDVMYTFFARLGFKLVAQDEFEETIMRLELD